MVYWVGDALLVPSFTCKPVERAMEYSSVLGSWVPVELAALHHVSLVDNEQGLIPTVIDNSSGWATRRRSRRSDR
jgi:hypothetical protein